ncbi:PPE domain-containing protein [Streptomyces sp. NPDC048420]|uniref:PPE domain-containing protein n=1 Tax=Streptomyces sp. NPDC048420 TaxID=3155755 RepID=UPI00344ACC5E
MADSDGQIDYDYTEMNRCFNEKHTTNFALGKNMDEMKAMLSHARPDLVTGVAAGWKGLAAQLASIQTEFEKEVTRIQAHWTGAAADGFAAKAAQFSRSIGNTAKYASHTSIAMTNAGAALGPIKDEVLAMEKPGAVSSFFNSAGDGFTGDDSGMRKDVAAGKSAQEALDNNHDDLSAGREAQLRMASKMEFLGAAYNSQAKAMGSWKKQPIKDDGHDVPGDPGGITPTPVALPTTSTPRSPQSVSSSTARRAQTGTISTSRSVTPPSGVTGGAHKPIAPTQNVGTAIDGIAGGHTGGPSIGGSGMVGGGASGGGGVGGGAGFVGGAAGGATGAGAARGLAGRAETRGMAGRTGGVGGSTGAGAARGGAARAGGLGRQSGGVAGGTPKAGAGSGKGTAGGSGLHSSRGAAGRGASASASRKGGVVGAPGARNGRPKDERREGERPDYLVEDEETWAPQRNVAPRVIEE